MVMVGSVWCTGGFFFFKVNTESDIRTAIDGLSTQRLYDKGLQQQAAGQLALAEKTFDAVVQLQPDNDQAHFQLAKIYIARNDFAAAGRAALRAAELEPDNGTYWNTALDVYRKTKNVKAIPLVLDELIRLNPENASFYHEKAYALFLDKRYEAALETCDTISARFGAAEDQYLTKHQIYMAQGNTDDAINE